MLVAARWIVALCWLMPAARAQKVLVVTLDDVGWNLFDQAPTPQWDRMVNLGRVYRNFYGSAICSPSRARREYGARNSHPDLLMGSNAGSGGPYAAPLQPLVPLARFVSNAGMSTAAVGKWHLARAQRVHHPNDVGYQDYRGVLDNVTTPSGYLFYFKTVNGFGVTGQTYLTIDETNDAITALAAGNHLVSLSYHAVHAPFHTPPAALYSGPTPSDDAGRIRAMLQALDQELGRLVGAALTRGYLVLIGADNGANAIVGGGKGTFTEAGVRVPMLAIGPGVLPGEELRMFGWEDVYATVADALGLTRDPLLEGPDSRSFFATLSGAGGPGREFLYSERWNPNGVDPRTFVPAPTSLWKQVARDRRFKLIRNEEAVAEHFFDLVADPAEATDLLGGSLNASEAAALARLRSFLDGI